jgi:hypothetical protein
MFSGDSFAFSSIGNKIKEAFVDMAISKKDNTILF